MRPTIDEMAARREQIRGARRARTLVEFEFFVEDLPRATLGWLKDYYMESAHRSGFWRHMRRHSPLLRISAIDARLERM